MPKYSISGTTPGLSAHTIVEAASVEEAKEIALDRTIIVVSYGENSDDYNQVCWTVEENEPKGMDVIEITDVRELS